MKPRPTPFVQATAIASYLRGFNMAIDLLAICEGQEETGKAFAAVRATCEKQMRKLQYTKDGDAAKTSIAALHPHIDQILNDLEALEGAGK